MTRFFRLVRLFVIRNIRQERVLTLLSVLGVALGIGLFVGVKVASDRAIASFAADIQGLSPYATHEIIDVSGIDFDERVYGEIIRLGVDALPALKATVFLPAVGETAEITAFHPVSSVRPVTFRRDKRYDIEALCRTLNGVMVTERFLRDHGLRKGGQFPALVYDREYMLAVVDVVEDERLPVNTLIMDLGNFQEYFGKEGFLTRIDLIAGEESADRIRDMLPSNLAIEKKEVRIGNQKALLTSFRYNLQFISLIAILVGMFLLYNSVFISVIKRRTEIGILRGLGISRGTVVLLFMVQGFILGGLGSFIGIGLGQVAAYFAVLAVEKTVTSMYATVSIGDYLITWPDLLGGLLVGIVISLAASAIPAYESSRVRPNESAREGSFEGRYRRYQRTLAALGILAVIAGGGLALFDYHAMPFQFPFLAYAGILSFILGFSLLSPSFLSVMLSVLKRPAERVFGPTGRIAFGDLGGNTYRFSVALMSVAVSSALIVALVTLIFSFRNSLKAWIDENITADVYIKPSSCKSNFCFSPLGEDVFSIIEEFPEVAAIDKFRTLHLDVFGRKVVAGFADTDIERRFARTGRYARHRQEGAQRQSQAREVSISHYLSTKYGLRPGDSLEIRTPKGREIFTVSETFSSYSTTSGFIFMDRRWLREFWGLDDATQVSLYLREGADPDRFVRKLRERFSGRYSLDVHNNSELRNVVLSIFNKSFAITYAIEIISILVSLIGVVNILVASVLERRREISIIRYLGGSWRQIDGTLVLSSATIGFAGIILGCVMGPIMSLVFTYVVNKISFGWEIRFRIPFLWLSLVMAGLFITTVAAGLVPSRAVRKIDPKVFISFE